MRGIRELLEACSPEERRRIARFFLVDQPHNNEVRKCVARALAIEQDVAVQMAIREAWRSRSQKQPRLARS